MRPTFAALLTATLMLAATPALAAPRTSAIDADKHSPNEASFTSKAAIVKFTGRTPQVAGRAQLDIKISDFGIHSKPGVLGVEVADELDISVEGMARAI